ncbi:MAG: hypothetical protein Q8O00_07950 [Holophaga sp.]|nr:hypothetical protein [Holophaga sp.]
MHHTTATLSIFLLVGLVPALNRAEAKPPKPVVAPALTAAQGPGDLLVSPSRVVFDMRKRTAALNLSNIGASEATYRISLVRMEMDEDGGLMEVPLDKTPGAVNLPSLIRFSPREVTLGAKEAQTIRLQVRKPAGLPPGEYRIHMMFRAIPPTAEASKEPIQGERAKGISVKLIPVYGLAIPLIVHQGETSAKTTLTGLTFDSTSPNLRFHLDRQGNQSVFGDLKVTWTPRGGATITVAEASGVAVYVPNTTRKIAMPLAALKGAATYRGGRLKVTFSLPPTEGGKGLGEAILDLP